MILHLINHDGSGTIPFEVQRPSLLRMLMKGEIPNHLKNVAIEQLEGKERKEIDLEYSFKIYELYCHACMVNPTYEEVKEQITDEQMSAIFIYAMNPQIALESFREERTVFETLTPSKTDESETK